MQLNIKGISVEVADDQIASLVLRHFTGNSNAVSAISPSTLRHISVPPLGCVWPGQGGIFTGIARGGHDGQPDHLVITGPKINAMPWDDAMKKAAAIEVEGHKDFSLPFRREQALQYANIPEGFENEWYWSCEQRAADAAWAWVQYFDNGYQNYEPKDRYYRARAVRRILIIQ